MSIKGDLIAIGIAGAVVLAVGWYAKKGLAGLRDSAKGTVKEIYTEAAHAIENVGQVFKPTAEDVDLKDAINAPARLIDSYINAAGQLITGNPNWNQASVMHRIDGDFGVLPGEGW
ncbi:hypothetical protein [Duganella radicis]|uniref:Uncharacterized protein n=1 Tax=Duganella radicis TaxID=551988 RepID=A0A6L6PBE3_9BURK|nr:hypothetical protein [Duganella radicis]MTV36284.1 hypothetical protein [Duganella radicis]